MITADYKELLFNIKNVPLIVEKTNIPAGYAILAEGQVIHQTLTGFTPKTNKELISDVNMYYNIRWDYAYYDQPRCNFAFNGVIQDLMFTVDNKHIIQPGIEILNSYNQRMSPRMYWLFYHRGEKCYIKTNMPVDFMGDLEEARKAYMNIDQLVFVDAKDLNINYILPVKIQKQLDKITNDIYKRYGKNGLSFVIAMAKVSTDIWERSSYELSRKTTTGILYQILKQARNILAKETEEEQL